MSILVSVFQICYGIGGASMAAEGVRTLNIAMESHQAEHYLRGIGFTALGTALMLTPFILSSSTPPPSSS